MPENALALGITVPKIEPNTGFVNALLAASQIKSAESSNALHQMELEKFRTNQNALLDYNTRMNAGDPDADKALAGAPDILQKVSQIKSLQTEESRKHALWSSMENANGARRVAALPPGPERDAAWNAELQSALRDRRITPETYKNSYGKPVNELMLQNAIRMGLSTEDFIKLQEREGDRTYGRRILRDIAASYGGRGAPAAAGTEPPAGEVVSSGGGSALGGVPGMGDRPEITSYPGMPAAGPSAPRVAQAPAPAPVEGDEPGRPVMAGPLTAPQKQSVPSDRIPLLISAFAPGVPESIQKFAIEALKHEYKSEELLNAAGQRVAIAHRLGMDPKSEAYRGFVADGKYDDKMSQRTEVMRKYGIDPTAPTGEKFALTGEYNNDIDRRAAEAKKFNFTPGTTAYNEFVIEGKYSDEQKKREEMLMTSGADMNSSAAQEFRLTGKFNNDVARRREEVIRMKHNPDDPGPTKYIFTGKWPGEEPISTQSQSQIRTSEEKIANLRDGFHKMGEALGLNKDAFYGGGAGQRGWFVADWVPEWVTGSNVQERAKKTVELSNLRKEGAIKSMSDALKGSTSDKDVALELEVAANPNNHPDIRARAIQKAQRLTTHQMLLHQDFVDQVREKTYTKPQGGRQNLSSIPAEALEEYFSKKPPPDQPDKVSAWDSNFDAAFGKGTSAAITRMFR